MCSMPSVASRRNRRLVSVLRGRASSQRIHSECERISVEATIGLEFKVQPRWPMIASAVDGWRRLFAGYSVWAMPQARACSCASRRVGSVAHAAKKGRIARDSRACSSALDSMRLRVVGSAPL